MSSAGCCWPGTATRSSSSSGTPRRPPTRRAAFDGWRRRGVPQFRLTHIVLPRDRAKILEYELPETLDALLAAGALRINRWWRAGVDDGWLP